MASKTSFLDAVADRRSVYKLTSDIPIPDARVKEIVTAALQHVPSAFDSQSTRLVVLLNQEHEKLWEVTKELLHASMSDKSKFPATEQKMDMFKGAHGTVSLE